MVPHAGDIEALTGRGSALSAHYSSTHRYSELTDHFKEEYAILERKVRL